MEISFVTKYVEIKYSLSGDELTARAGPLTVVIDDVSGLVTDLVTNGTYDRFLFLCKAAGIVTLVSGLAVVAIKHLWPYIRVNAVYGGCFIVELGVPATHSQTFENLVKSGKMREGLNEKLVNAAEFFKNLVSDERVLPVTLGNISIDSLSL